MRRASPLLVVALVAALSLPAAAATPDDGSDAEDPAGSTVNLALPGVGLVAGIALDADGKLAELTLDPAADGESRLLGDHKVSFRSEDGATRLTVKAKNNKTQATVKAADRSDLVGLGGWEADLFDTGTITRVAFEVAGSEAGLVLEQVTLTDPPPGAEVVVHDPVFEIGDDGDASSKAVIDVALDGAIRTVRIKVTSPANPDEPAKLKITVKGKEAKDGRDDDRAERHQRLPADAAVGVHTWQGESCDGSPLEVVYEIGSDGSVTVLSAGSGTVEEKDDGVRVRFPDTKARLDISAGVTDEGLFHVKVRPKADKCKQAKPDRAERGEEPDQED